MNALNNAQMTEGRQFLVSNVGLFVGSHAEKRCFCEQLPVSIVELSAFTVQVFYNSLTDNDSGLSEFGRRSDGMAIAKYQTRSVNP